MFLIPVSMSVVLILVLKESNKNKVQVHGLTFRSFFIIFYDTYKKPSRKTCGFMKPIVLISDKSRAKSTICSLEH